MKKLSIEDVKTYASQKRGICLSDIYVNNISLLKFMCEYGHIWEATYKLIKRGHWCSKCAKCQKLNIYEIKLKTQNTGVVCLSEFYINSKTKLKWQCKCGNIYESIYLNIVNGHSCKKCALAPKYTIKDAQSYAAKNNGKCLSIEHRSAKEKLTWECKNHHIWDAEFTNIRRGCWCPDCKYGKNELEFKLCLEKLTQYNFNKIRPAWLKNKKGNKLELDGFNAELKLAFEYQGRQHFEFVPYLHKNEEKFQCTVDNDKKKEEILQKLGIILLKPNFKIKPVDFEKYIIESIKNTRLEYLIPNIF